MANIFRRGLDAYKNTMNEPEDSEGLLKSAHAPESAHAPISAHAPEGATVPEKTNEAEDSKIRRVAKFLILIGTDRAASILSELDPEQVKDISREIAGIRGITSEEGEAILAEFRSLLSKPFTYSGLSIGGIESARRILYAALGPDKGEALLNKAVPNSKENIFGFLENFAPEQLALLLKDEGPTAIALVLSCLPPKLCAASLKHLPKESRLDILKRIAFKGEVSPEVLERVAQALREKARQIGGVDAPTLEIDGMQTLAAILKQGDYSFGERIASEIEQGSPDIGRELKEKMYTLDDVLRIVDRYLQEKLKAMSDRDIAILLKGKGKDFSEKILSCVSAGRRELIREEGVILGAVPKRDCDSAASEFLVWFRQALEDGRIMLLDEEDVFV